MQVSWRDLFWVLRCVFLVLFFCWEFISHHFCIYFQFFSLTLSFTFSNSFQDPEIGGIADRPGDMVDVFHTLFGIAGAYAGFFVSLESGCRSRLLFTTPRRSMEYDRPDVDSNLLYRPLHPGIPQFG